MKISDKHWQTIWYNDGYNYFSVIDQSLLPHKFEIRNITSSIEAFFAIKNMIVRGAPLIGVTGAYGFALGIKENPSDDNLKQTFDYLNSARPTAINLNWGLKRVFNKVITEDPSNRFNKALLEAKDIEREDKEMCSKIGEFGKLIIENIYENNNIKSRNLPINILTHCNAGWLATVDWGTALAPIYKAHRAGINLHIWVDETRPRNQGANLTSFELKGEDIPHTVITDNAGGYLMQNGEVDLVIVGSDRTTSNGDVCNKIGTYLKALAAKDNEVPFYAALPISTIDWEISDGLKEIPIEARSPEEVSFISGKNNMGEIQKVQITPDETKCFNPSFDVTPSNLVTGLITEKGICRANLNSLREFYK
tara:strand:+ start:107 stop:1201 length:1095 start_codon:yes stop_codon:yes gene_type:complete